LLIREPVSTVLIEADLMVNDRVLRKISRDDYFSSAVRYF